VAAGIYARAADSEISPRDEISSRKGRRISEYARCDLYDGAERERERERDGGIEKEKDRRQGKIRRFLKGGRASTGRQRRDITYSW